MTSKRKQCESTTIQDLKRQHDESLPLIESRIQEIAFRGAITEFEQLDLDGFDFGKVGRKQRINKRQTTANYMIDAACHFKRLDILRYMVDAKLKLQTSDWNICCTSNVSKSHWAGIRKFMQSADVCSADKKLASVLCGRECPREWFTEAIRLDDPHFLIFVDKHSTCRVSQSDLSDAAIDGRLKCVQMIIRHFKIVPNLDTMRLFVRKSCVPSSKLIDTFKVLKCAYGNQKPNYVIDIAKQQQRALYSLCPSYPSASLFAAIWKRDLEFLQTASTNKSTKFSKSMFKAYMRGFDESPESPAGLEVLDFLLERCTLTKKMRVEVLLQKNTRLLKLLRQSQELTESDQKIDASLPSGNKTKN